MALHRLRILLAPVPAVHLQSATEKPPPSGICAFGSRATQFFDKKKLKQGTIVLICASQPKYGASHLISSHAADFLAVFDRYVHANELGEHPLGFEVRPLTTWSDGPWSVFWEVKALTKLENPVPFHAITWNCKPLKQTPRGPREAYWEHS